MEIDLTDVWDLVLAYAAKVHENKRKHNVRSRTKIKKWDKLADLFLAKSQFAAARYFGLPLVVEIFVGGDKGHDLVVDGQTIEVKYNSREGKWGYLIFDYAQGYFFKASIAVLTVATAREKAVRVAGWTTRRIFERSHHEEDWGIGAKKYMRQSQLFPMDELNIVQREVYPFCWLAECFMLNVWREPICCGHTPLGDMKECPL